MDCQTLPTVSVWGPTVFTFMWDLMSLESADGTGESDRARGGLRAPAPASSAFFPPLPQIISLSVPQFPSLSNGDDNISYFGGLFLSSLT